MENRKKLIGNFKIQHVLDGKTEAVAILEMPENRKLF